MNSTERELVRQTLFIVDGDAIRASTRIRDAIQIIKGCIMPFTARKSAVTKLEEANKILFAIPKCKERLYKLLDEQSKGEHDSS